VSLSTVTPSKIGMQFVRPTYFFAKQINKT
jgi:hypothetical protein